MQEFFLMYGMTAWEQTLSFLLDLIATPLQNIFNDGLQVVSTSGLGIDLGFIDRHILDLNAELASFAKRHGASMTGTARALCAIFALIVAAGQAYKMMTKGEGLDVLQLARPILIALILTQWSVVVDVVTKPGNMVEAQMREMFEKAAHECADLRKKRTEKAKEVGEKIMETKAAADAVTKSQGFLEKIQSYISEGWKEVQNWFKAQATALLTQLMHWVELVIVWFGELAFQVAIYIVFLLKAVFMFALAMFGPIQFAASILPIWKDAWHGWVAKAVSVSLYGACAYMVMAFSMVLIQYGLESDMAKLTIISTTGEGVGAYLSSSFGTTIITAITYFVGCIAMTSVSEMSTWAIPGNASMAASGFIGGLQGRAKGAANMGLPKPLKL